MLTGSDILAEANTRMQEMSKDELIKLVFIASNRVGIAKHGDSEDTAVATASFLDGVQTVFSAYDTASFNSEFSGKVTWGVHNASEYN